MTTRSVSNTPSTSDNSRRGFGGPSRRILWCVIGALTISGVGATALAPQGVAKVSTKSSDPVAQAALVALAGLGTATEDLSKLTVTVPPTTAPAVTVPPATQPGATTAPPPQPPTSTAPSTLATVPPPTVAWVDSGQGWKSAVVDTDSLTSTTTTIAVKRAKSQMAFVVGAPTPSTTPVRMLPASTTPAPVVQPVQAEAAPSSIPQAPVTPNEARRRLAELVVGRIGTAAGTVDALDAAWANTEVRRLVAVYSALAQVGTPYRYSGNEPGGFDCSGLTSFAWAAAGVKLPRTSTDQINAAKPRSPGQLLPGDLVWRPGHIMMYLGIGQLVVDSPQTGKTVRIRDWGRTSRYGSPI